MSLHHEVALLTEDLTKKCAAEFLHDPWTITIQSTPSHRSRGGVQVRLEVHHLLRHQTRTWIFTRDNMPKVNVETVIAILKEELLKRRKK
jgi:hypothetical protein